MHSFYSMRFGTVCHIPMHPTFCKETSSIVAQAAKEVFDKPEDTKRTKMWSPTGTAVTIEGPRFSTRAESLLFKSWNCDVINMTTGWYISTITCLLIINLGYEMISKIFYN